MLSHIWDFYFIIIEDVAGPVLTGLCFCSLCLSSPSIALLFVHFCTCYAPLNERKPLALMRAIMRVIYFTSYEKSIS